MIVSASSDKTAIIWNADTYSVMKKLVGHSDSVNSAEFSPDGERVATASSDKTVRVWSVKTGEEIKRLQGHISNVNSIAWSPDGQTILTASSDGTAKIWETNTYECLRTIRNIPGLEILGCDFRSLHKESTLTGEDRQLLWEYGAEV